MGEAAGDVVVRGRGAVSTARPDEPGPAAHAVVERPRRREWRRRSARLLSFGLLAWGVAILGGMNPSVPSDAVLNLLPIPAVDPRLAAPAGNPPLVVLQHGMWRSAWALWRLERALRAHGHDVLNVSYPSTRADLEDHATALARAVDAHLRARPGPPSAVWFVGHSMGGLVIRTYLSRPDAVAPAGCVFIATPHRGAELAARRQGDLLFRWLLGTRAALQLVPGHRFYHTLRPLPAVPVGTIVGGRADDEGLSRTLGGDDDGTVRVCEARCADESDTVLLPLGHTRIGMADAMIRQVLHFVRHQRFAR